MLRVEEKWMMRPPLPAAIIARPAACESQKAPLRLISSTWFQASSSNSSAFASRSTPARLTTISSPPSCSTTSSTSASTPARSERSTRSPIARPPASVRRSASSDALSRERPAIAISAPQVTKSSEVTPPMPPYPPTINPRLPSRRKSELSSGATSISVGGRSCGATGGPPAGGAVPRVPSGIGAARLPLVPAHEDAAHPVLLELHPYLLGPTDRSILYRSYADSRTAAQGGRACAGFICFGPANLLEGIR